MLQPRSFASPALLDHGSFAIILVSSIVLIVAVLDRGGALALLPFDLDGIAELGFLEAIPLLHFCRGERVRFALQERDVSWDEAFDLEILWRVVLVRSFES